MSHEVEITERLRDAIVEAIKFEMDCGWSLDQIMPIFMNAVEDAVEEIKGGIDYGTSDIRQI